MRFYFRGLASALLLSSILSSCVNPQQREIAALENELGLKPESYFPKCLSREISPEAALGSGSQVTANAISNPQGDVPLDRCVLWETDEPVGKGEELPDN